MGFLEKSNVKSSILNIVVLVLFLAPTVFWTVELICEYASILMSKPCSESEFRCGDGTCIPFYDKCNGYEDCAGGTDESLEECAISVCGTACRPDISKTCELPQYPSHGSYVVLGNPTARPKEVVKEAILEVACDPGFEIYGSKHVLCRDETWRRDSPVCVPKYCVLPAYPEHGTYSVEGVPDAAPGQQLRGAVLSVECHPGYVLLSNASTICFCGIWSESITTCVKQCRLEEDPSVKYRCLHYERFGKKTYRSCKRDEPEGTIVKPHCQKNYDTPGHLKSMRCIDGKWNYVARCLPLDTSGNNNDTTSVTD